MKCKFYGERRNRDSSSCIITENLPAHYSNREYIIIIITKLRQINYCFIYSSV